MDKKTARKFMGKIEDIASGLAKYVSNDSGEWNDMVANRALKSLQAACDHLEDIEESYRPRGRMLRESASEWFDESGWSLKEIPEECVEDICHPGPADEAAEEWVERLGFEVPREKAIEYLREYGAWDKEELEAKSDKDLAITCLWLGAWDTKENGEWFGLVH